MARLAPGGGGGLSVPGEGVPSKYFINVLADFKPEDSPLRPENPQPSWLGYSVGKWEGDWMVVDTIGFNDQSWLDASGHPHSDALHTIERFHRRDYGHMEVQVTIDDPKTFTKPFTKPFTFQFTQRLIPDTDLMETYCPENEKDAAHLK